MNKIVVTGGAGFICSALVRGLLASGVERVTVIDNLLSGKRANLEEVMSRVDMHQLDIRNHDAIASVLAGAECGYHLASIPSLPTSITPPFPSHAANID